MVVGVIETRGDTDTPVWIEALGCGDRGGCTAATAVVAQRALVRFVDGQTLELPLLLASACVGVGCASDQRCATDMGQCEPATRAQEMVRPFTGIVVPGVDDAAVADARGDVGTIVDSSLDGGTADLGTVDAGVEDAGPGDIAAPEAGPPDVGRVDAGIVDTGVVDAGVVDTGPLDTGVVDAGVVDTGVVDTGPRDTGPTDTGPRDTGPTDTGPQDTGPTELTITCTTLAGSRTCRGSAETPPCCVILTTALPPSCGTQVLTFGCVPN
ncbi:MAG: hypothetical protein Q7V43_01750 [Myxococcales bacterium]|nr:hypothetical protein [Myxococcales bacterium]